MAGRLLGGRAGRSRRDRHGRRRHFSRAMGERAGRRGDRRRPQPSDVEGFAAWLANAVGMVAGIHVSRLGWSQRRSCACAFSTLLWVRVADADGERPALSGPAACRVRHRRQLSLSCRGRESARISPFTRKAGSTPIRWPWEASTSAATSSCSSPPWTSFAIPRDLFALGTDALAEWAMQREEAGTPPDWNAGRELPVPAGRPK